MVKKLKYRLLALVSVVALACLGLFYYQYTKDDGKQLTVIYGEKLPAFQMQHVESGKYVNFKSSKEHNVLMYLSETCNTCISNLPNYKEMMGTYDGAASFTYVWKEGVPMDAIKSLAIPVDSNYALNNKHYLSEYYPMYFIVGKDLKVEFATVDLNSLKNKLKKMHATELAITR